ncbi:MAG: hypothetical protein IPF66_17430 [Holophagales bacterium]|nr:hypothetical protein [Holophagales bacterium]
MRTGRGSWKPIAVACVLAAAGPAFADFEDDVERAWAGAWVVAQVEMSSDCLGIYNNNEVRGRLSSSKGSRRFAEGELARVDKVNVKSDRVDLYLSVAEPVLAPRTDGPFTLYDERSCRIQFMVDVPREAIKGRRMDDVEAQLLEVVERHESETAARRSRAWNRRERDAYPPDYEETLARHAAWKAEEINRALAATRMAALDAASQVMERVTDDPPYLDGFAAGVDAQRNRSTPSCPELAGARFESGEQRPPTDRRGGSPAERAFQRGFRDGQLLAWSTRVARGVEGCFVVVPGR